MGKNLVEKKNEMVNVFKNEEFGKVMVTKINNKEYFCAKDVAKALGYKEPHKAISRHCRYGMKRTIGVVTGKKKNGEDAIQQMEVNFIPEGDVYRLIVKSKLPSAEKFEKWVFDEVLPTIRKTGGYINNSDLMVNTYFWRLDNTEKQLVKGLLSNIEEQQKLIVEKDNKIIEQEEKIVRQEKIFTEIKPALEEHNILMNQQGAKSMMIVSKELNVFGRTGLFRYLRDKGILMSKSDRMNIPYQQYINNGYFRVAETVCNDGNTRPQTFVFRKGCRFIIKLLKKDGYLQDVSIEELLDKFYKLDNNKAS